jgi:hypothetical protein
MGTETNTPPADNGAEPTKKEPGILDNIKTFFLNNKGMMIGNLAGSLVARAFAASPVAKFASFAGMAIGGLFDGKEGIIGGMVDGLFNPSSPQQQDEQKNPPQTKPPPKQTPSPEVETSSEVNPDQAKAEFAHWDKSVKDVRTALSDGVDEADRTAIASAFHALSDDANKAFANDPNVTTQDLQGLSLLNNTIKNIEDITKTMTKEELQQFLNTQKKEGSPTLTSLLTADSPQALMKNMDTVTLGLHHVTDSRAAQPAITGGQEVNETAALEDTPQNTPPGSQPEQTPKGREF